MQLDVLTIHSSHVNCFSSMIRIADPPIMTINMIPTTLTNLTPGPKKRATLIDKGELREYAGEQH
jgi:hypothetical protein